MAKLFAVLPLGRMGVALSGYARGYSAFDRYGIPAYRETCPNRYWII
ncbi:hypothetical protein [Candidatus Methylomirabilis sp.]